MKPLKPPLSVSRIVAFIFSLALGLPGPAYALRTGQAQETGLEERITQSLRNPHRNLAPPIPTGLEEIPEETAMDRLGRNLVEYDLRDENLLQPSMALRFDNGWPDEHLIKDSAGEWWVHMHFDYQAFPLLRNGFLFHIVRSPKGDILGLDRPMAESVTNYFVGNYMSLEYLSRGPNPPVTSDALAKLIEKGLQLVQTQKADLEKAMREDRPMWILGEAVEPAEARGLYMQLARYHLLKTIERKDEIQRVVSDSPARERKSILVTYRFKPIPLRDPNIFRTGLEEQQAAYRLAQEFVDGVESNESRGAQGAVIIGRSVAQRLPDLQVFAALLKEKRILIDRGDPFDTLRRAKRLGNAAHFYGSPAEIEQFEELAKRVWQVQLIPHDPADWTSSFLLDQILDNLGIPSETSTPVFKEFHRALKLLGEAA